MDNYKIKDIHARQVFDSRANPTIEAEITLESGIIGRGIVPSGASTGKFEALELRDMEPSTLGGKSVIRAVKNVNEIIAPEICGMDVRDQAAIDNKLIKLDGTSNKSALGANSILGVSMAAAWAGANAYNLPLYRYLGGAQARTIPLPMIQIIGGGAHAANVIDIQDFLVIPIGSNSFTEGFEMVVNVFNAVKRIFSDKGKPLSTADEGGFWPTGFHSNEEGIQLIVEGIEKAGYIPGKDLSIALDIASSEFYDDNTGEYLFGLEKKRFTSKQFADYLCSLVNTYPIISVEDGMSETDWEGGKLLTEKLGKKIQLIGDDLFTTNISRIEKGVKNKIYNSVLIKMNQIGTISETLEAIEYTKNAGYLPVISARSGETEDITIVHLAIASNAGQIKVGSVTRSERTVKWNELIRIEERLNLSGLYKSDRIFDRINP